MVAFIDSDATCHPLFMENLTVQENIQLYSDLNKSSNDRIVKSLKELVKEIKQEGIFNEEDKLVANLSSQDR